eukprot:6213462-Pyramimonas_sp.AAC.1
MAPRSGTARLWLRAEPVALKLTSVWGSVRTRDMDDDPARVPGANLRQLAPPRFLEPSSPREPVGPPRFRL